MTARAGQKWWLWRWKVAQDKWKSEYDASVTQFHELFYAVGRDVAHMSFPTALYPTSESLPIHRTEIRIWDHLQE